MSLIEEALRRTQHAPVVPEPKSVPAGVTVQAPPQPIRPVATLRRQETSRPRAGFRWQLPAAVLGIGVVVIGGLMVQERIATPRPVQRAQSIPAAAKAPTPVASAKQLLGISPPTLELSGVVEGAGESLAIINGIIVKVGETIEDATLLDARQDSARLRWRDQELVLRTGR